MKPNEIVVGEAVRIDFEQHTGKLFLVFEITDEKRKQDILKTWTHDDICYRLIGKQLIKEE